MSSKVIVGIDPGLQGAIAVLGGPCGSYIEDMPVLEITRGKKKRHQIDLRGIANLLRANYSESWGFLAIVEEQQAYPGQQGAVSNFSIGAGFFGVLGILTALQYPYQTVHPKTWQKVFGLKGGDKEQGCLIAERLFPSVDLRKRTGKARDGRSDALLIAEYGRRIQGG